jgi:hypothetical protein
MLQGTISVRCAARGSGAGLVWPRLKLRRRRLIGSGAEVARSFEPHRIQPTATTRTTQSGPRTTNVVMGVPPFHSDGVAHAADD